MLQASQKMTNSLMLTTCMMNIGTLFSVSAMASAATASFVGASAFGLISLINFAKVGAASLLTGVPVLSLGIVLCASVVGQSVSEKHSGLLPSSVLALL